MRHTRRSGFGWLTFLVIFAAQVSAADPWVVYDGFDGPGHGKHIVLVSGDEEYRSEEALPQLGKILAKRHGFKCTVLFAIDPDTGEIDPLNLNNIPGLESLETADLMIIATRFRDLPDDQMQHIDHYLKSGGAVIGMRTATHAFNNRGETWAHYKNGYRGDKSAWTGGFGRLVLGERWISHHGRHGKESTRGMIATSQEKHPILRGIKDGDIWGPTDVYGVRLPLPGDSLPLVMGQVVAGMSPADAPASPRESRDGKLVDPNDPMMPIAWTKSYQIEDGKQGRVFTTTMGSSNDLPNEGLRRLLVNAVYWAVGLADEIQADSNVDLVGTYEPTEFKVGAHQRGLRPADFELGR